MPDDQSPCGSSPWSARQIPGRSMRPSGPPRQAERRRISPMAKNIRREILKGGLAVAGLGVLGIPEWALPALAQGEVLVPFTDLPETINLTPTPDRRLLDVRT